MEKIIDLHIHTNESDGAYTPKEVIDEAYNNGVSVISICDHDTVSAYTEEVINYAKEKNITLIKGVEISTKIDKCGIHILGYNIDITNKKLIDKLEELRNSRHIYLKDVSKKLKEAGYFLNVEKLDKIASVTKAHIAYDVVSSKENEKLLMDTFGYIPEKGEFIEKMMNENCPCYVKKITITPTEASKLIKDANGLVVIAHPVAYTYEDNLTIEDIKKIIVDTNANGIETNYIYIHNNKKINEIEKWNKIAKSLNVFTTIGSDFHNKDNIYPNIGLINDINLSNELIIDILNNLL